LYLGVALPLEFAFGRRFVVGTPSPCSAPLVSLPARYVDTEGGRQTHITETEER
jgi:hypothetical protein